MGHVAKHAFTDLVPANRQHRTTDARMCIISCHLHLNQSNTKALVATCSRTGSQLRFDVATETAFLSGVKPLLLLTDTALMSLESHHKVA